MSIDNRKIMRLKALFVACALMSACATGPALRYGNGPTMGEASRALYNGPKARLTVAKFADKSAKNWGAIGNGMADMLTTSLFQTNRFILLDRTDLDAVINEQDFSASDRVSSETAAKIGELEGAELLVFGAITEFEPEHIGVGGVVLGIVSLGASIAIKVANRDAPLGAVTYKESHVAIDLKIVDAKTGSVVHASSVEGHYDNYGGGIIGGVGGGASRVPVHLGGFGGTGVEEAIRKCIDAAVRNIVRNTPREYYRVTDSADNTPAGAILPTYPIALPLGISAAGVKGPSHQVIGDQASYGKLMARLGADLVGIPAVDFSQSRLLAIFGGKKNSDDWRVGVRKLVKKNGDLVATVSQAQAIPPQKRDDGAEQVVPLGSNWPFDIVRIDDTKSTIKVNWDF